MNKLIAVILLTTPLLIEAHFGLFPKWDDKPDLLKYQWVCKWEHAEQKNITLLNNSTVESPTVVNNTQELDPMKKNNDTSDLLRRRRNYNPTPLFDVLEEDFFVPVREVREVDDESLHRLGFYVDKKTGQPHYPVPKPHL